MNFYLVGIIFTILILIFLYFWDYVDFITNEIKRQYNYYLTIITSDKPLSQDHSLVSFDSSGWQHKYSAYGKSFKDKKTHFWSAAVPIDIDSSGKEYIFLGGSEGQGDALLVYNKEKKIMENIIEETGLSSKDATYSAIAVDLDKDGYQDMIVARQKGVYLYKNNKDKTFTKTVILNNDGKTYTTVALAVADYNKDKIMDLYVSTFINPWLMKAYQFNNPDHAKPNIMLRGNKDGTFTDVTKEVGSPGLQNTFSSTFIDLNKDGYPDLIVSPDTGQVEIYENKDGKSFERKTDVPKDYGYWMGIAQGDFDKDQDTDLFFTNLGTSVPNSKLFRGDLKDDQNLNTYHVLLRNDGNFKFTNIASKKGVEKLPFGWGATFEDIDFDGKMDLLFSTNFVDYPPQQVLQDDSVVLLNKGDNKKFMRTYKFSNKTFSQTPLYVDLNDDGIKDIVWVNIHSPSIAYISKNKIENNFINISLPKNSDFINSDIVVETPNNKYYKQFVTSGIGFASDQSNTITFGLGKEDKVDKVTVKTPDHKTYVYDDPKINKTLVVLDKKINSNQNMDSTENNNNVQYENFSPYDEYDTYKSYFKYGGYKNWRRFDHIRY